MKINKKADAVCMLQGSREYRNLRAVCMLHQTNEGVLIRMNVRGFPISNRIRCNQPIVAFHIHEGKSCTGNSRNPFADAKGHYNPNNCSHPYHAGDLGNLFINRNGSAFMSMLNDRFTVEEVLGRVMILHQDLDDFKTQPSGNSGKMIACGVIRPFTNNRPQPYSQNK